MLLLPADSADRADVVYTETLYKHEVAPFTRCYIRLNYSRPEWSGGTTGCVVNMSRTTRTWATASR